MPPKAMKAPASTASARSAAAVHRHLGGADLLGPPGHLGRQQGVERARAHSRPDGLERHGAHLVLGDLGDRIECGVRQLAPRARRGSRRGLGRVGRAHSRARRRPPGLGAGPDMARRGSRATSCCRRRSGDTVGGSTRASSCLRAGGRNRQDRARCRADDPLGDTAHQDRLTPVRPWVPRTMR